MKQNEINQRLQELTAHGCMVSVTDVGNFPVVYAERVSNAVFWVEMLAQHQSHCHVSRFHRAELVYGRDVALRTSAKRLVAYFAPFEEFRSERRDFMEWRRVWNEWLAKGRNRTSFEEFVKRQRDMRLGLE